MMEGLQRAPSAKVKAVVLCSSLAAGIEGGLMNYLDRLQMPPRP